MSKRLYEIARELKVTSEELAQELKAMDPSINAKDSTIELTDEQIAELQKRCRGIRLLYLFAGKARKADAVELGHAASRSMPSMLSATPAMTSHTTWFGRMSSAALNGATTTAY